LKGKCPQKERLDQKDTAKANQAAREAEEKIKGEGKRETGTQEGLRPWSQRGRNRQVWGGKDCVENCQKLGRVTKCETSPERKKKPNQLALKTRGQKGGTDFLRDITKKKKNQGKVG